MTRYKKGVTKGRARQRKVAKVLRIANARSSRDVVVGIDVSQAQGTIDWNTAASNINFAMIKATDGVDPDPTFQGNWTAAGAAGVKTGAYHFFRNIHSAQEQFDQLKQTVTNAGDFPVALDIENTPNNQLTPQDVPVIGQLMALIKGQYGKLPISYNNNV